MLLCASCEFTPAAVVGEGSVTCELVHQRQFATFDQAGAGESALRSSPTVFGHERREPQDVCCVFEVAADDPAALNEALQQLSEDPELWRLLKHVHEGWIGGKNPYAVTLAEARAYSGADAVAMLEGDGGGQTYVVSPLTFVRCDETTLKRLLLDIDAIEWPGQPEMAKLSFFRATLGEAARAKGGGMVTAGVWVHKSLRERGLEPRIVAVLAGERPTIG